MIPEPYDAKFWGMAARPKHPLTGMPDPNMVRLDHGRFVGQEKIRTIESSVASTDVVNRVGARLLMSCWTLLGSLERRFTIRNSRMESLVGPHLRT